jgi:hypothetical protein
MIVMPIWLLGFTPTALGQVPIELDVGKFRNCSPISACSVDCVPTLDCSPPNFDVRDCRNHNVFAPSPVDAVCEAAKAEQNALYARQKNTCEAQKIGFKFACEAKKLSCQQEAQLCLTLKNSEIAEARDETNRLESIFEQAGPLPSLSLPRALFSDFASVLPSNFEIKYSTVDDRAFSAFRWGPFSDGPSLMVLPVQDRLIFKKSSMPRDVPQVGRALIWLNFLQSLGTDGVAQALKLEPGALEDEADKQMKKFCGKKC